MINKDRIVPVTKTDLLTLYYTMIKMLSESRSDVHKLEADNVDGDFTAPENPDGIYFCTEPVRSFTIPEGVATFSAFFIPAHSFTGIEGVDPDGMTLYESMYRNGTWMAIAFENE